jgi:hypothetical protein
VDRLLYSDTSDYFFLLLIPNQTKRLSHNIILLPLTGYCQCEGLALEALLITPVQRIPRYRLLFENLMRCMDDSDPNMSKVKSALKLINQAAQFLNEEKRVSDRTTRLMELAARMKKLPANYPVTLRHLLKEGTVNRKARKSNWFLLLDNSLIIASE